MLYKASLARIPRVPNNLNGQNLWGACQRDIGRGDETASLRSRFVQRWSRHERRAPYHGKKIPKTWAPGGRGQFSRVNETFVFKWESCYRKLPGLHSL
jgi:hypothetical protein